MSRPITRCGCGCGTMHSDSAELIHARATIRVVSGKIFRFSVIYILHVDNIKTHEHTSTTLIGYLSIAFTACPSCRSPVHVCVPETCVYPVQQVNCDTYPTTVLYMAVDEYPVLYTTLEVTRALIACRITYAAQ